MDGTFLGIYESKILNWENLITKDPTNACVYQREMDTYMINCLPYMLKYMNKECNEEEEINTVFNIN